MSDPIDRLQAMKERLEALMAQEAERAEKLDAEIAELDTHIALANALAALKVALPYLRHEGPRMQALGASQQIKRILAA